MNLDTLDRRPIIVAIAGPNGAGKSLFYRSHVAAIGLPFVNADVLSLDLQVDAYRAAELADSLRRELVRRGESFVFETVLSDPVGDKVAFLGECAQAGYEVVLYYIGIADAKQSEDRVSMRVSQGGHDVPTEKIQSRFARTIANLGLAIRRLPHVWVYDNSDLARPYHHVATFESGKCCFRDEPIPAWLNAIMEHRGGGW